MFGLKWSNIKTELRSEHPRGIFCPSSESSDPAHLPYQCSKVAFSILPSFTPHNSDFISAALTSFLLNASGMLNCCLPLLGLSTPSFTEDLMVWTIWWAELGARHLFIKEQNISLADTIPALWWELFLTLPFYTGQLCPKHMEYVHFSPLLWVTNLQTSPKAMQSIMVF